MDFLLPDWIIVTLLYGLSDFQIKKLQRLQNSAARILTKSSKFDHITPVLYDLHWLPVKLRIHFKILIITFKAYNGLLPSYINNLICEYRPTRSLRSQNSNSLETPHIFTSKGENLFSWAGPTLWNKLPLHIRSLNCLTTFKRALKTHIFTNHFNR